MQGGFSVANLVRVVSSFYVYHLWVRHTVFMCIIVGVPSSFHTCHCGCTFSRVSALSSVCTRMLSSVSTFTSFLFGVRSLRLRGCLVLKRESSGAPKRESATCGCEYFVGGSGERGCRHFQGSGWLVPDGGPLHRRLPFRAR